MAGLTNRQRVKVNAALSLIYAEGYDAQTVHNWASEYKGQGYPPAKAFERALNEFVAGQPEVGAAIGKITRLIHASDDATVAKYDQALNEYIATGNDAAISALGPMMAQDSVALSVRSGELADGTMSAEALETALGFIPADGLVSAAMAASTNQPSQPAFQAKRESEVELREEGAINAQSQVSPFAGMGLATKQDKWAQTFNTGSHGRARTLLQGHVVGPDLPPSQI